MKEGEGKKKNEVFVKKTKEGGTGKERRGKRDR